MAQEKDFFHEAKGRVEHLLLKVFGDKAPSVEVNGDDHTDWSIDIDNWVSLYRPVDPDMDIAVQKGVINLGPWQVAEIRYSPGSREVQPDVSVDDVGEPHRSLDFAFIAACKLVVAEIVSSVLEEEFCEDMADEPAAPHSWKP